MVGGMESRATRIRLLEVVTIGDSDLAAEALGILPSWWAFLLLGPLLLGPLQI